MENKEVKKLFVEPVLQGDSIGAQLLEYAIKEMNVQYLWALEKNSRAIAFYERHGFRITRDKKLEEDTSNKLIPACNVMSKTTWFAFVNIYYRHTSREE